MNSRLILAALAALSLSLASCVTGGLPPGAELLGDRTVTFTADHDVVEVGAKEGQFRSLVIVVEKNDVEIFNVVVEYGNGQREAFDTRLVFHEGSRSRPLQLAGGTRRIRAVEFRYKTVGTWIDGRAHVLVYGVPLEASPPAGRSKY